MPIALVHALGLIKRAAAEVNRDLGSLDRKRAAAITAVAQDIADGKLDDNFPLLVWQTGSGTQSNMNVNEVIANLANVALGGELGAKTPVHPNDHVNMSQSSNDSIPTAMHIAAAMEIKRHLLAGARRLACRAGEKDEGVRQDRQDRPHPHDGCNAADARPGIFRLCRAGEILDRAHQALDERVLSAGAGRHRRRHRAKFKAAIRQGLCRAHRRLTRMPFVSAPNKFEHMAGHDAYVFVHGALNAAATALFKVANDIRLLGSGPRSGLGELILPSNELGSSIMPGKTNPTQSEALTMVCCQVFGNQTTVTVAGSQGHFELNVYKPVLAYCMMQSIRLLGDAARSFTDNCVVGIQANEARIRELMERSLMLVTALSPHIGYDQGGTSGESRPRQRNYVARRGVATRVCRRRGVRPAGAAGKNDAAAVKLLLPRWYPAGAIAHRSRQAAATSEGWPDRLHLLAATWIARKRPMHPGAILLHSCAIFHDTINCPNVFACVFSVVPIVFLRYLAKYTFGSALVPTVYTVPF